MEDKKSELDGFLVKIVVLKMRIFIEAVEEGSGNSREFSTFSRLTFGRRRYRNL